jgi:hypothetical protein
MAEKRPFSNVSPFYFSIFYLDIESNIFRSSLPYLPWKACIKKIAQSNPDVGRISAEALSVIAHATGTVINVLDFKTLLNHSLQEIFIRELCGSAARVIQPGSTPTAAHFRAADTPDSWLHMFVSSESSSSLSSSSSSTAPVSR